MLQDFEPEKRKVICKTLRFVSHTHGAHLQFFSSKQEGLISRTRGLISHLLFKTTSSKTMQLEHNKPLMVPVGMDSFQQIGTPPLAEGNLGRVSARTPLELWKIAYTGHFPQETVVDPSLIEDPAKDPQYTEAAVDAARVQKDEELERYRRLSERRMRTQRAMAEGVV
ncbi:hypothetical protein NP493_82g05029 [Ridgeia piscesae]|uniref:Uncharacterized protein n=1 Tax=Ridgeia piscesae TaxID=27915 RepID=A0AAD9UIA7_RIDPI|nr:hypothetical protein NP493_82g05029 [Ridgeia piscesae]